VFKKLTAYFFFLLCFLHAGAQQRSLDYFVSFGLSGSPLLKDYNNQIRTSIQDSLLIRAGQKPKINATGQILVPPYGNNFGYDEAISNGGNYSALVGISQSLFMKNILNNKYENIDLQKRSATNNSKITTLELKKLITQQYYTAYAQNSELIFAKEVMDLLQKEEQILKQLTEKGIYKETEYYSFLIEKQTQESKVLLAQIDYRQELYNLDFICGITDTALYTLSDTQIVQSNIVEVSTTPVYQKFILDSITGINSQKEISLKYKPTLAWFADAGVASIRPWQAYQHFGFSFGLNFTMPVYDGKQKEIEIRKLGIEADSRKNYEDFFKKQYSMKSQQLKQKVASYDILTSQIEKQLASIKALIEMNKLQLNTGELSVTDHILTVKNYIETKHQLITLQLEKLQTINELNYISF